MTDETIQTLLNTFTPKGENADKLLELQLEEIAKTARESWGDGMARQRSLSGDRWQPTGYRYPFPF